MDRSMNEIKEILKSISFSCEALANELEKQSEIYNGRLNNLESENIKHKEVLRNVANTILSEL